MKNNNIPTAMKAFPLMGHGDLEQLVYHEDWPTPVPDAGEVLIKVHACGLNNTDVNTRTGWYSKAVTEATTGLAYNEVNEDDHTWGGQAIKLPRIQGGDVVGTAVAVGVEVDADIIGKRVMIDTVLRDWSDPLNMNKCGYLGSEADGGYAQYIKVDQRSVLPVNCNLTDAELATFAISYSTAENMLTKANVTQLDTVLITGASGGVGSALVQLANRRGATTIAMASESKHEMIKSLNPDYILPRKVDDLEAALKQMTGKNTVSVVADIVGGDGFADVLEVIERNGRYTCAGAIGGPIVDFDLRTFYLRDLTMVGATVLPLSIFPNLISYIERGEIKPILAATYPLEELKQAQQAFIDKKHTGNIVVTVD